MRFRYLLLFSSLLLSSLAAAALSGCASYEVNNKRGGVPGYYIRSEMQQSDRALDSARAAGKDKMCPAQYQAAEAARDNAYNVFRACHTEEGAALARQATAMANAPCPVAMNPKAETVAMQPSPAETAAQPKAAPATAAAVAAEPAKNKYCVTLNIQYDIGRAEIRPEYRDEVNKVGAFMKKYPSTTAVIQGYTDEVGSDQLNLKLSQERAENVVAALENDYGIDPSRLTAQGFGKSHPVADNVNDTGRQENRRIDAVIDCAFDVTAFMPPPDTLCMTLNAHFDTGSAEIRSEDYASIDKVGEYMRVYPTTTAVIEGHTDSTGSVPYNMKLSQARAESIVNYLVQHYGIEPSRLTAKGLGATHNIAYNSTPQGREKNRRINAIIDCAV